MARDDGLLIKPEPRKPWVKVAVAAGVLAVLAGGYVAFGLSGKPTPGAAVPAASSAPVAATADQLPAIIIAVLPLAAEAGDAATPAAYGRHMAQWLAACQDGSLLMCHPANAVVDGDAIGAQRPVEFAYLQSTAFGDLLAAHGCQIVQSPYELFRK